jgi:mono/diheme cytochrome c family protein
MRRWFSLGCVIALELALAGLLFGSPQISLGQQGGDETLEDPLVRGAWLYEGNCIRCHGPYEQQRVGRGMSEDELSKAIEGGSGGCSTDWSTRYGGPFRSRDAKAVIEYILTWEALGQPPELPPLPPQPTSMPTTNPAAASDTGTPGAPFGTTHTPTPTPTLDPWLTTALESSDLALGAWLFTQHCHRCHLDYADARMGRSLDEKQIERTIREGKVGTSMPAFDRRLGGKFRVRELRAVVHYIVTWETLGEPPALPDLLLTPPTPDPADLLTIKPVVVLPVTGDVKRGARLFVQHCAACHGLHGEGGIGSQLAKAWPSPRPDLTVQSVIRDGVPGSPMPAWGQRQGGPLNETEVADLVALIMAWQPALPSG